MFKSGYQIHIDKDPTRKHVENPPPTNFFEENS
jgi:hypothetical protein